MLEIGVQWESGLSCRVIDHGELVGFTYRLFLCYTGTGSNWVKCPLGTYSNLTGLMMESECLPCPGGQYCDTPGITEPSGNCSAGKIVRLLVSGHVKGWQSHNTSILEFKSVGGLLTGYC